MTMPRFARLDELPLGAVRPQGWLKRYLEKQRDGLTGHIDEVAYPFNTRGWGTPKTERLVQDSWWPYEQTGYWVDGLVRCAHLLGDRRLLRKGLKQIENTVRHPDPDGYLGPTYMKEPVGQNRWAHAVFFRAIMAHASATGDRRFVRALHRHYLSNTSPHTNNREVCNVEHILWTYARTGDRRLLRQAVFAWKNFADETKPPVVTEKCLLSGKKPYCHGVTYMEVSKIPAILYLHTGRKRLLRAAVNAFRKLDRHSMLIDGVPSSSEFLAGRDALESHETCDIADYTWSAGYLLMATGKGSYADRIERACFNAAPGAVRSDFKALQYLSCANQVIVTRTSNHNVFKCGEQFMAYRPFPGVECCTGDVNRIMPNYVARMWMENGRGGLAAVLYGPCAVSARVGRGRVPVTIVEKTDYPFSERIEFHIRARKPVAFPLSLRIPSWCRAPRVLVNGKPLKARRDADGFVTVRRTFADGDMVTLDLPMKLKLVRWPAGGVAIERGPLVYSLRIEEDWRKDFRDKRATKRLPAWNLRPASPWNYALAVNENTLARDAKVTRRKMPADPWDIRRSPIALRVPARRVKKWDLVRKSRVVQHDPWNKPKAVRGQFLFTPPLPPKSALAPRNLGPVETVTLVPYGCTHLRVTLFPAL